jgi:flagellar M-ring protein FliF
MGDLLNKIKEKTLEIFKNLDMKKRILFISLSLGFVIIVTASIMILTATEYVTLASGLTLSEAAEIDSKLTELGISHKDNNVTEILVDKDSLSSAKMALSIAGVYNKKDFTWTEAFNNSSITMTSAEKSKMYLLAQASALASSIESIDSVENAIVNLYVPDDSSFLINDSMESRVSCVIKTKSSTELSPIQVNGIKMILLNSVKGLSEKNISIIDTSGKELTNANAYNEDYQANSQYELKTEIENRLKNNLVEFLENIYGSKNIEVLASVTLDFDSKETVSEVFQPPNEDENLGLIRSMSEVSENVVGDSSGGAPGTDSNGGNTQYNETENSASDYQKISKNLNYELNKINTRIVKARGTISDISLAVIINTKVLKDEILTEEHKAQIEKLVSASAGLNAKVVEVSAMEFVDELDQFDLVSSTEDSKAFNILIIIGLVLVFAIIIIFVIVFMKKKSKVRETELVQKVEEQQEALDEIKTQDDDASSPKYQINKFIDKNPEAVAQLLKAWLNEG